MENGGREYGEVGLKGVTPDPSGRSSAQSSHRSSPFESTYAIPPGDPAQSPPRSSAHQYPVLGSADGDGFLGPVARWGEDEPPSRAGGSGSVRTTRLMGMRGLGVSPPPPPGPPPSDPPPLPPGPELPRSSFSRAAGKISAVNAFRNIRSASATAPPSRPPPTSALPPIPQSNSPTSYASLPIPATASSKNAGPSGPSHSRQGSTSSSIRQNPDTPSRSSSLSGPSLSPRVSSLFSPGEIAAANAAASMSGAGPSGRSVLASSDPPAFGSRLDGPIHLRSTSPSQSGRSDKPPRTPSRQLLQNALDLAQKAVEMDKNNDVVGSLAAYREAVHKLKNVMERVGGEPSRDGRRKNARGEEEGRTLRGIHDAYVARIQLLTSYEDSVEENRVSLSSAQVSTTKHPYSSTATLVPTSSSRSPRSDATTGERTPRPSLDDSAVLGIGNLMLAGADQSFDSSMASPSRSSYTPSTSPRFPSFQGRTDPSTPPAPTRESPAAGPSRSPRLSLNLPPPLSIPPPPSIPPPTEEDRDGLLSLQQALDEVSGASTSSEGPQTLGRSSAPGIGLGFPSSVPTMRPIITPSAAPLRNGNSLQISSPRRIRKSPSATGLQEELGFDGEERDDKGMEVLTRTPQRGNLPGELDPTRSDADRRPNSATESANGAWKQQLSPRAPSSPDNRPLPPVPNSAPLMRANSASLMHPRTASLSGASVPIKGDRSSAVLVNASTAQGTISQRRSVRDTQGPMASFGEEFTASAAKANGDGVPASAIPFPNALGVATSRAVSSAQTTSPPMASTARYRSKSQPGGTQTEVLLGSIEGQDIPPPMPPVRQTPSRTSQKDSFLSRASDGLRVDTPSANSLGPPASISSHSATSGSPRSLPPLIHAPSFSGSLMSPLPEPQPGEIVHRPFHVLRVLYASMDPHSSGSYLTGAVYISSAVWKPSSWGKPTSTPSTSNAQPQAQTQATNLAPPKIVAQDAKVRIIEALLLHLEIIRSTGAGLLDGPRDRYYGSSAKGQAPPPLPKAGSQAVLARAEEFGAALDGLDEEMDHSHKTLAKNGVVVVGWKGRKSNAKGWGSRITKTMDKMTNQKALDSPDKYVDLLSNLCYCAQIIDEHLHCFTGPCSPAYHSLPEQTYRQLEARMFRASEFFGLVVVPFILSDLKQFFSRYLKGGLRYLEE